MVDVQDLSTFALHNGTELNEVSLVIAFSGLSTAFHGVNWQLTWKIEYGIQAQ